MRMWTPDIRGGQLELLSRDEIQAVHYASMEILHQTGITVLSERALKVLDDAGADVHPETNQVKIPPYLVEEALRKAPSTFTLAWRGKKRYRFEQGRVHFGMAGSPPFVHDLNGVRRQGTYEDVANFFRLGDALKYVHCPSGCVKGTVEDMGLPETVAMARRFLIRLQNTEKPGPDSFRAGVEDSIRLQLAVLGGGINELRRRPMTWYWHNPTSPLVFSKELTDNALVYANNGLPILFAPEVMGGVSGPMTLAGILALQTAEFLAGAVIAQTAARGHRPPVVMGCVSGVVDMKTSVMSLGSAESGLLNIGTAQMARFYNVPSRGTGGTTEAMVPDGQSGIEGGITLLLAALAGHTFIYNAVGALEPAVLAISYEKALIDHDTLGMATRILGGMEISDKTLATDVIDEVVTKRDGNFLFAEHTREHFRSHFYPEIFNRELWEGWKKNGSRSVRQVARERVKQIIKDYEPQPLEKDIEKDVKEIIQAIEKRDMKT